MNYRVDQQQRLITALESYHSIDLYQKGEFVLTFSSYDWEMSHNCTSTSRWHLKWTFIRTSATLKSQNGDWRSSVISGIGVVCFWHSSTKPHLINNQPAVPSQKLPSAFVRGSNKQSWWFFFFFKVQFKFPSVPVIYLHFVKSWRRRPCVIPPLMWSEEIIFILIIENQFQGHLTDQARGLLSDWEICPEINRLQRRTSTQSPEELQASLQISKQEGVLQFHF